MNNGNMPATACTIKPSQSSIDQCYGAKLPAPEATVYTGLSKREALAMAVMQGLVSNNTLDGTDEKFAVIAVSQADALLKELSNVQND